MSAQRSSPEDLVPPNYPRGQIDHSEQLRFEGLIKRSIEAWRNIRFAHTSIRHADALSIHVQRLRSMTSIEDILRGREYWFFQRRESFIRQERFVKFDLTRLIEYILLPIDYGWVNAEDCFFVSHYWRTENHPDPDAIDLQQIRADLATDDRWSYIWVDWTCMPQRGSSPGCPGRSPIEKHYFQMMLQCIPMLVRDCAFTWRFPEWEPRAWVLYEVGEYLLMHTEPIQTGDTEVFAAHINEMIHRGVAEVLLGHGYRCTNASDLKLVTGWLELLVILRRIIPDTAERQYLKDYLDRPCTGSMSLMWSNLEIDKVRGTVRYNGDVHYFTPMFHSASEVALPFQG